MVVSQGVDNGAAAGGGGSDGLLLSRDERIRRCGVDCVDAVVWKHWSVGGEYLKKLSLKNTHDKLQVIEYRLPQRKATFFVDFPTPVTLSSGMAYELEIRFRPSELVEFHDFIEIYVQGRGSFKIALDALTPFAKLDIPSKHDFEFCPVTATATKDMLIENKGTIPLDFYWEVPEPFDIQPRMGSLSEGQSMTIKASFRPAEATSMVCRAVCKRASTHELLASMKLSGIGKFTFVTFADPSLLRDVLDFGSILTKSSAQKSITIVNRSAVDAQYVIKRVDSDIVCPFQVSPSTGVVPRDGSVKLSVRYTPAGSGAHAANDFMLQTVGGNQLTLRFRGTSTGPTALLSTSKLEFGDVNLDELPTTTTGVVVAPPRKQNSTTTPANANSNSLERFVTLKNTTDTAIQFQFVGTNPGAAFVMSPFSGQIPSRGSINIKVSFAPKQPINYLRRLFLLINDTEQALYIDLIGTAYNAKSRPAPFTIAEARAFFARIESGLGRCTPDDLAKLIESIRSDAPVASDDDASARQAMQYVLDVKSGRAGATVVNKNASSSSNSNTNTKRRKGGEDLSKVLPNEDVVSSAPFVLDRSQVVLRGYGAGGSEGELVMVRNNTSAKAIATWAVPDASPWSVSPESQDVAPFSSAAFRVRLSGTAAASSSSSGSFLECYVNFKQMRSFRLVSEDTFCPPHCLLLQCQRLVALNETASVPHVEVPAQLAFPPCHERDSTLQVVSISNKSDTVAAFHVQMDAQVIGGKIQKQLLEAGQHVDPEEEQLSQRRLLASVFTCFPSAGIIPPNDTILLLMKFSPPDTARYAGVAKLLINDSPQGNKHISLRGEGFSPVVDVEGGGVISFRPTSVGGSTERSYKLHNPSRIPIRYSISITQPLSATADIFQISPSAGVIPGCGSVYLSCSFLPQQGRRYDAKVRVEVQAEHAPVGLEDAEPTVVICQASGEGLIGVVSLEPLSLSYGSILVGESKSQHLTIFNSSLCDLQYQIRWTVRSPATAASSSSAVSPLVGGRSYLSAPAAAADALGSPTSAVLPASQPTAPEFINGRGVIRARSHINAHVTIQPSRGAFEYILYVIVGGSEDICAAPDPSLEDILRLPHCSASIVGAFPFLQVTDTRSVLQPKSHLWRQMSVLSINEQLSSVLTPADLYVEGYSFSQASEGITPIRCDLGVDVFRTTPLRIMCRLDNQGSCPAKFRIWFPDESDIPKEPWHQTKLYGDDVAEVVDAGLFDVSPRDGVVEPGGNIVLTLTYKHTRIGEHQLPVLIMLEQGKKVLLVLSARTLPENVPYLYFHHSMRHDLVPVAVGDLEPPLQYTELQNLSHQAVSYSIDEQALAEVREANYDFPIFQCLNPAGLIPPMSTMLLSWYFRPLEAKRYDACIIINVEGSDPYTLRLGGQGYHPRKVTNADIRAMQKKDFLQLPKYPTLQHPLLPVRLSMDVLRFGAIPFHSLHRQVVTIRNDHPRDTFLYEWHCVLQYGDQIFDVDPPRGRILAGQSATCRITLYSGSTSHIIDNPIHCHVLNEALKNRRLARRAEVEREAAMELDDGQPEVAISADGAGSSLTPRSGDAAARSGKGVSSTTATKRGTGRPRVRQPVTTIPPKFQNTNRLREAIQAITEAVVAEDVDENSDDLIYVDVLPTILEIVVQARIMPVESFRDVYGEPVVKSMFFPTLASFSSSLPRNAVNMSSPSEAEWSLVHDILEDVVKQVVHHPRIEDAFKDCSEDPVPYFCEIANTAEEDDEQPNHGGGTRSIAGAGGILQLSSSAAAEPNSTNSSAAAAAGGVISGDLQCLIEEVLEAAVYGIISESQADEGVITAVALKRSRSFQGSSSRALTTTNSVGAGRK